MYFANYVYFSLQLNDIRILGLEVVFLHPFGRLIGGRDLHTLRKCTVFYRFWVFYRCLGSRIRADGPRPAFVNLCAGLVTHVTRGYNHG